MAAPPAARIAGITRARQPSTAFTAAIAASRLPVWPTMSGLAKLQMMTSCFFCDTLAISASATPAALISGCRS